MRDAILALVTRHCETLRQEAGEIDQLITIGIETPPENLMLLARLLHKLKGSSATIGFAEISALAARMETVLESAQSDDREALLCRLNVELQRGVQALSPAQSKLLERFQNG